MVKEFKEKEITIGFKEIFAKPVTKRASSALKVLREGVIKETRAKTVKLSGKVNEAIWQRGKFKGIRKLTVKVIKDKETAKVYLKDEKVEEKKETKKDDKKSVTKEAKKENKEEIKTDAKTEEKTSKEEPKK